MQKTRIICTIGPATQSYEMLRKMYDAGMNIVRLNMSHGTLESHAKVIQHIKTLNQKVEFPIPLLLDTQGPEIRTGDLPVDLNLQSGSIVSISARGPVDVEESSAEGFARLVGPDVWLKPPPTWSSRSSRTFPFANGWSRFPSRSDISSPPSPSYSHPCCRSSTAPSRLS